jgi:cytochrome c-type biogenesis protein CcmH
VKRVLAVLLLLASPAFAVSDPAELLPDRVEESNADLARDLRRIIRQRVLAGDSDQQVVDWMVARYGNFVRLRPPFNAMTFVLWGAPGIALLAGITAAVVARRRRPAAPAPLTDAERQRLADLLKS